MYDLDIKKENPIINTEANESIIEMLEQHDTAQNPAAKLSFPALRPTVPHVKSVVAITKYVGTTSE